MRLFLWAAAGVLLAVAAVAVWFAFSRPDFVLGLAVAAVVALGKAVAGPLGGQIAHDITDPEVDRRNKAAAHRPAGPIHPGTGATVRQEAATRRNRPKP